MAKLIEEITAQNARWDTIFQDINAKDTIGNTRLHRAGLGNNVEEVMFLVKHKANLEIKDDFGCTALCLAAQNGHKECLQALLDANCDKEAAHNGGATALSIAAFKGHENCLQPLLNAGCNKEAVNIAGATALGNAAMEGQDKCLQVLLNAGCDMNKVAPYSNKTPLKFAKEKPWYPHDAEHRLKITRGQARCVQLLEAAGANGR